MANDHTKIEWTDATWSPVVGCTHVSPGCDHCYAASLASGRLKHTPTYAGLAEDGKFNGTVRLMEDRLTQPLKWRKPRRIFVNSMSDLFHDSVPTEYIAKIFAVMAMAEQHQFQVLTKRHARMRSLLSDPDGEFQGMVGWWRYEFGDTDTTIPEPELPSWGWPLPNVWLGVSVEDQKWADIRIPALLDTPAAVRFLSCEPLLGPVDQNRWLRWSDGAMRISEDGIGSIGWVIVGGESGHGARPMHPAWARQIRDQCTAAGVPFLFKQWGEWAPHDVARPTYSQLVMHGAHWDGTSDATARVGKKAAGRELDGRTWDEFPAGVAM